MECVEKNGEYGEVLDFPTHIESFIFESVEKNVWKRMEDIEYVEKNGEYGEVLDFPTHVDLSYSKVWKGMCGKDGEYGEVLDFPTHVESFIFESVELHYAG
ncbi:hypothetical protein Hypma_012502 [Hypsizygus marmoreus]|uniref:Uncharacterized protein n=1 Tax=Hypsizygus marmoreus TaxID=39966 RepID=A0A369JES8_HYPMA|nr:hypothetical protein Hypma_012502 [Hypsizygus marmoreus]